VNRLKRILIVDDEPGFTRLMKLNLELNGAYEVVAENRGADAVATARVFRPDVIFLDVMMPDMDGGAIAAALRADAELCRVPVVFLTAVVSQNEVVELGGGKDGQTFLAKPVTLQDVVQTIERLLP